jgi:hypothetical protein
MADAGLECGESAAIYPSLPALAPTAPDLVDIRPLGRGGRPRRPRTAAPNDHEHARLVVVVCDTWTRHYEQRSRGQATTHDPDPRHRGMLSRLISIPSVSSVSPVWDQSNRPVLEPLADWLRRRLPGRDAGDPRPPGQGQPARHPGQRPGRAGAGRPLRHGALRPGPVATRPAQADRGRRSALRPRHLGHEELPRAGHRGRAGAGRKQAQAPADDPRHRRRGVRHARRPRVGAGGPAARALRRHRRADRAAAGARAQGRHGGGGPAGRPERPCQRPAASATTRWRACTRC